MQYTGTICHSFQLPDETGTIRTPADLMGAKGLLLVFIQGTWCPPCVTTLYYLAKHTPSIEAMGVNVAVIAMDDHKTLNTFKRSASLPIHFPLLADPDNAVREQFLVTMIETYLVIDPNYNIRATFLDEDGQSRPGLTALTSAIKLHLLD